MSRKVVGTTISVALMVLLFALDLTVVATALPTITGEFHGAALYGWVFSAYAIPVTATTLLYGRIADILGRRRLFSIVVLGFLGGSILCGFSQSMVELVIFRAM
ncbi:MAG: MFS transporter, partial [Chloroflexota bacterium]